MSGRRSGEWIGEIFSTLIVRMLLGEALDLALALLKVNVSLNE